MSILKVYNKKKPSINASRNILKEGLKVLNKILNPRNVEDSGLTDHHTNSFTVSGDVLASESNTL